MKPSVEDGEGASLDSESSEGIEGSEEGAPSGETEGSEEGSSPGAADIPGEGSSSEGTEGSGEDKSPEDTLPPTEDAPATDEEIPKEEDTECTHQEIRYVSKKDGTHEIVCEKCEVTLKTEKCTYEDEETVSGNTTVTVSVCKYCGYILEESEEEEESPAPDADVVERASEHKRIAYFSFDDDTDGFTGDGATAEKQGSPGLSSDGWKGKALNLSNKQYLTVASDDNSSLLTGLEGITVSYFSKAADPNKDGAGWAFYAAPNTDAPKYNDIENYLGILDHVGEVRAEKFIGNRNQPTTTSASASSLLNEWRHVAVTFNSQGTSVYINGELKKTGSNTQESSIANMLGESSIIQIGKAQWGSGEYYNGLIDEFSIYDYVMDESEIKKLYADSIKGEEVADPMMLAHYTFDDIAIYDGNASKIDRGKVSDGAVVPNTSEATAGKDYDAVIVGDGASLRAGGSSLELPGGNADSNSAYVQIPSGMFTDENGKMRDTLSINIWMQNLSNSGNWTGFYVGTDPAKNGSSTRVPANYLLLNPRKLKDNENSIDNRFKVALTHNEAATGAPYSGEDMNINGATNVWWQMYTVVVNSSYVTTYLDGKHLATVQHSMKMSDWTDGTNEGGVPKIMASIGAGGYLNDPRWHGAVKECSIYNYELSQEDITQLYNDVSASDESAEALVTAQSVSTDFLGGGNATITFGDSYELPTKTTVALSDGSSNDAYVAWYDENGKRITDTSLLETGTHTLTGKLENYFPAPFIEERADPQVYYDEASKKYYFTSSWPAYGGIDKGYDKIVIRQSDTLVGLADAEEHTIWTPPGSIYTGVHHIWAPELHHIGSKWYCYFTGALSGDWDIRPRVLVCDDSKDITKAENWTEHDRFVNKDGAYDGAFDDFSLDMTHFENNGKHYVIWAYKRDNVSMLLMGEVDGNDPTKLTSDPMVLTYPEYAWECVQERVDEGPSVLKKNGRIYVVFSAAATGDMYCMGMISAPDTADLMNITSWTKCPTPVLQTKDLTGQYGPGHNSFTVDDKGNAILVYHARDEECHNKLCGYSNGNSLYDPCRNAMLAYVRYDSNGNPVFNSTAEKEMANLDTSQLKYTLTVETLTGAKPVAEYKLVTDAKDSVGTHEGAMHGENAVFDNGLIISGTETGKLANYLDVSGNTELLSALESAKAITITAWVRNDTKNTNNNNHPTVFSLGHDENNFFAFSTGNWAAARATFRVNGTEVAGGAETSIKYDTPGMQKSVLGEWYPIAITLTDLSSGTKSLTEVRYYMDDELLCTVNTPASLKELGSLERFYIGGCVGTGQYNDMYGGIRNVRIYNKALPAETIVKCDMDCLADNLVVAMGADSVTHAIETKESLKLPLTAHPGVTYTWESDNADVIDNDGSITPLGIEQSAALTATIKSAADSAYGEKVTFPVTVLGVASEWLEEVCNTLRINNIRDVRGNLYLPLKSDKYPQVKISWKSGNPDIISDETKDGIAPGIVNRPDADTDVKLTATISIGEGEDRQTATKTFTAKVKKKAQVGEFTDYLFAYFIGEGTRTGEQMYFADSRDGLHWTALNDGSPVMTSSLGEKGLRDPFIMRSHEGDKFYLIATDLWIAGGTSWGDSQTKGSQSIMVWESTDLVNWSDQRMCKVAVDDAGCTWAPEAFWDEETQDYAVFWASKTARDGYGPHHIWKCHTRDFYTYSEPEIWITLKNESGNDISVIDTTVIKVGDTYYRFNKNEDGGKAVMTDGSTVNTKVVYMEKSSSLDGTWEYVKSDYLLDESNQYREGATSFKFNDDDVSTDTWCLLLDNFGGGGYYPATTTDMASGSFTKLNGSEYSFPTEGILRHGSVLNITADEYAALEKKWGPFVEEEETPVTTLEEARIASFTFDDDDAGFRGSGAVANKKSANGGTIELSSDVRANASGKSAKLSGGGWLDVKTKNEESLLTGVESMSISYFSKAEDPDKDGAGWSFFATPNANAPVYNSSEYYLGVLDQVGRAVAQRFYRSRNDSTSTAVTASSLANSWRHVVVNYSEKGVKIYIDGELKEEVSKRSLASLPALLGDNSILQLGKGNWGDGEYFNGYIDDVTIYNRTLTQEEVKDIFAGKVPMPDPDETKYTVTFDPNEGTLADGAPVKATVEDGGKLTKPEDPTRKGYAFLGWSTVRDGSTFWDFETDTVTVSMKLYACWEAVGETVYTVTINPNGGIPAAIESFEAGKGEKIAEPGVVTREGYTFLGWSQTKDGTEYWDFETDIVTGNMTLYACWKPDVVQIIYDANGGTFTGKTPIDAAVGSKLTKPEDPTREGYLFSGWSQVKDGETYWNFDKNTVSGAMTLYACWAPAEVDVQVTFDPDGGTLTGAALVTLKAGEKITKPEDPTKDGYTFLGWSQTKNGAEYWDFENDTVTKDITLYACWQKTGAVLYTVTYDPDGGILAGADSVKAEEGAKIEIPGNPTKEGCTFLGWSQTKGGTEYWDFNNDIVTGDMTLYACWKSDSEPDNPGPEPGDPELFTVIFNPNGGILAGMPSVTVKKDEKIAKPENPSREGYKFQGWSQTKDEKKYWNFDSAVIGNMTLYACWMELGDVLPDDVPEDDGTKEDFIPNGLWIAGIEGGEEGFTYTGKAIKPEVRVYNYKTLLKEKTDYTISYKNNVNASNTAPTISVKGKGNYTGQDTKTFKILPKNIEDADVSAENVSLMYKKNKTQKPDPAVKWNNKKLAKKDLKMEYPDTIAGAYQAPGQWNIKVTGEGNYTGTREITLYIAGESAKLTSKLSVKKIPNQIYKGTALTPEIEVKDGRTVLEAGKHYDVSYENNIEIGTAAIIITGKTDSPEDGKDPEFSYVGEKRVTFNIVGTNLSKVKVTGGLESSYEYTGKAIIPVPVLTDTTGNTSKELQVNTDYIVKYTNNRNAGTATVTFTGIGGYTGTFKKTFKITAYDMSADESASIKIRDLSEVPYAKGGSRPKPVVTYRMPDGADVILKEDVDYTLSYKNNSKLYDGSGSDQSKQPTVTVKGKGNYKGSKTASYKIVQQDISKLTVQADDKLVSTKPNKYQSVPKVIDLDGKALKSGTDYEKTFEYVRLEEKILENGEIDIVDIPIGEEELLPANTTVKITVKAKENGSYTGEISGTYRIIQKSISKASVKVKEQTYTGKEIKPDAAEITQIRVGKDDLAAGTDYEIIGYSNNIKKGTAKMTIRGLGEYGGTKTVSFKIKAKGFLWWDNEAQ